MAKFSWNRRAVHFLGIAAFAVVTIEAKSLTISNAARPATENSCSARMMHNPAACPPTSGMSGNSCCNMQICFQLFLQTGELHLQPDFSEFQCDKFDSRERTRRDRPPVPPPRV